MSAVLKIVHPGFHTSVQDAGRRGYQHVGVPVAGALDRTGLHLANALVGNDLNAACLEIIGLGPEFEIVATSARIALVGGGGTVEISGRDDALPFGQSIRVVMNDHIRVRLGGDAFCSYLAIEGGFDVPLLLGSRSTYTRAGFGGYSGRLLKIGDRLDGTLSEAPERDELSFGEARDLARDQPIRVVTGPQDNYFSEDAIGAFLSQDYTISALSDRMGFRMDGAPIAHSDGFNIVSDGIVTGSIQVPGSGLPIVLMADAQTAGGYPKIATVISADLPVLALRNAGRIVKFTAVSRDEAEAIRRTEQARVADFINGFQTAATSPQLNVDALYKTNLIGGVVDAAGS